MTEQKQLNMVAGGSSLSALFKSDDQVRVTSGANQLNKTAELTSIATRLADDILKIITEDPEQYGEQVLASQKSHDAMDDLIAECYGLTPEHADFLKTEDEDTLEKMLRSQQSKRSRAKSKVMTQDNYHTMLVGAIGENLIRLAMGKAKSSGGGAVMGDIGFSTEDLDNLALYPEELKKAIRNVQSKKSIMKSKADFDPLHPRWQQLLVAEQQLKGVRDRVNGTINEEAQQAIEAKKALEEALSDKDLESLSPEDAKAMLNYIKDMMASK